MQPVSRLKFGIFMGPFHPLGENPTLALERDLELIQWLDYLGFDEAWVGEHHSAGWETIASPEIFLGIAAERTKHIKLGTGVVSLPYHHPLMTADRMVLLDHLTRGRVMFGVGPGALPSDALMIGLDPNLTRPRMDEALTAIIRLFTEVEPITIHSDWFTLENARLQLRPYTHPHMPIAVTAVASPAGMVAAGKHGAGVLSFGLPRASREFWGIAEQTAAEHGKTMDRANWRLVIPVHLAENRDEAFRQIKEKATRFYMEYRTGTLGIPLDFDGPVDRLLEAQVEKHSWCIGTPDDLIEFINVLQEQSGGFGGFMVQPVDWASREEVRRSHELIARYVMPQFQGSLAGLIATQAATASVAGDQKAMRDEALARARAAYAATQARA